MASIINRSAFTVTVPAHPSKNKFTRRFAFSQHKLAENYMKALLAQGLTPDITQSNDTFLVKVVRVGHKDQFKTFRSLQEAEAYVKRIESEATQGLFRDYTQAAQTTTAQLIERYIREDCPGLKGGDNYIIILRAMLEDSKNELRRRIEQRKQEVREFGKPLTPLGAMRQPMTSLEWLHLPLHQVKPEHIEDFIADRVEHVLPSTVDRQLDLLASIYNRARKGWRIHMDFSPMDGVKRPRFFNERDRRLRGDEEARLLQAARQEDQMASFERHVEALVEAQVQLARKQNTYYAVNKQRKLAYEQARKQAIAQGFAHIPMMETFVLFQLATAARRGETLGLFWDRVDREDKTAFIPTSKNGRPRKLSLRSDIVAMLERLPKTSDLVFDIGLKELTAAWRRMCDSAGIEDLRIHDLRHEAISRAAESGKFTTVLDLQAFSGHREIRSLSRYTHLCASAISAKLEEAESERQSKLGNKGRMRLKQSDLNWLGGQTETVSEPMALLLNAQQEAHECPPPLASSADRSHREGGPVENGSSSHPGGAQVIELAALRSRSRAV